MKSTNYKTEQLTERPSAIFRKRLRWFATLIVSAALCVAASSPLAAQAKKTSPRFVDNGDGTVTDNQTGLMWEKKTDTNVNDTYTWSSTFAAEDGTLFTKFLATLRCTISADGRCGLAGYYDCRIPNISELRTTVDCSQPNCIDPVFGPSAQGYWSASSHASGLGFAWIVIAGTVAGWDKFDGIPARAVRGGR